ncbi:MULTISPECIES: Clp protease N-terminal domain-containing protein [Dictyoglomus]|mgnify:CR=1 FL=1|jgi:ATP-dependent Clp protease ATP-binding subunit ClpA|uniref:Clp domain protein n=1 Tax=Dictyoglomus turgidum (strain DSM 6724 / Z-1310) TaxID=515635 RepID=B8E2M7_DICTD|nr:MULTISPECIES: Clp protease N-terminal domain-containing protein [Dictyoglomus]ACK42871.1 Clp domain protein [Dictyoglomus turgidum DSM 6724]HBU30933.1 Clp protease [Dictyoglomus sp.]
MKTLKFKSESIILNAEELVLTFSSPYMDVEHLLLSIINDKNNKACKILQKIGVDLRKIKTELEKELRNRKTDQYEISPVNQKIFEIFNYAQDFAEKLGREIVDAEHLLLGILKESSSFASKLLFDSGVSVERVLSEIKS